MSVLRSIVASVRVGWYREFNWTNPFLGFSMRTVGPLAGVIAASSVYFVGSSAAERFSPSQLAFILIGAALYTHVAAYSWVPTLAIRSEERRVGKEGRHPASAAHERSRDGDRSR